MARDDETMERGNRQFPVTDWGHLQRLQDPENPDFTRTLNRLAEKYWNPVFHYVRILRRVSVEDAKDLTQQFFTRFLSRGDLFRLSPERGSFRGFLKTAIRNFTATEARNLQSSLPRGEARLLSLEPSDPDHTGYQIPGDEFTPEEVFDREWIRVVLKEAIHDLEQVLSTAGKRAYFDLFKAYYIDQIIPPDLEDDGPRAERVEPPTYAELAESFNLKREDVSNFLRYSRQKLRELLRARVKSYVLDPEDVDEELQFILS